MERDKLNYPANCQVSSVQRQETMERWETENSFRRSATLLLPGLQFSFLTLVNALSSHSPIFQNSKTAAFLPYIASKDGEKTLKDLIVRRINELQCLVALESKVLEDKEENADIAEVENR
ncbi:MAG: hypothetical protein NWE99_08425 [Candidatus Bathyarchaeota archaeon]|nr:hypothetical protein [Candidatus Bathyarchaeota archaeon]